MYSTPATYTKITSTPTNHAWSHTYSAGNLSALLSLTFKTPEEDHDKDRLETVGKDLLSTLESEYFTLEDKSLFSIKRVVITVTSKVPEDIHANIIVSTLVDEKAYLLLWGGGKIFIKRHASFGLLLEANALAIPIELSPSQIESASGILQQGDLLFLVSEQLLAIIPEQEFLHYFVDTEPSQAQEQIEPLLQHKRQGGACAIVIKTHSENQTSLDEKPKYAMKNDEESIIHSPIQEEINKHDVKHFSLPKFSFKMTKKTILLAIAAVILFLLIGLIIKSLIKQPGINAALFQSVYSQASSKYYEAQNLETLNRPAAYDDYVAAQKILIDSKANFPGDTNEGKKLTDLLIKITEKITATNGMNIVTAKLVDTSASEVLHQKVMTTGAQFVTQEASTIYTVSNDSIIGYDTTTKHESTLIKNDSTWSNMAGIGVYFNTIYLLDKTKGAILKFSKLGATYSKSSYFPTTTKLDFSSSNDIAIDGSIWMISDTGTITKFTKAKPDIFTIKDLEKPFSHPTRISTTTDDNANLYILDNGNSRIVTLTKDGSYVAQYSAAILKDATEIDVHQAEKIVFVLSAGKVYQINL